MNRWAVLAARNLLRHRRRTFLTGSIVVVGFVAVTMTAGFVSQTFSALKNATIRGVGGHLRLLDPRAARKTDDEAASILLEDWPGLAGLLSRDPHVVQAMPKLSFFGLVVKGEKSAAYLGTGHDSGAREAGVPRRGHRAVRRLPLEPGGRRGHARHGPRARDRREGRAISSPS